MIKKLIVVLAVVVVLAQSACVVTELKNAVNNSLVFAGNASVSASSTNNLYFLFYGAYGVIDRSQLKTHPTLVVFGKYSWCYSVQEAHLTTLISEDWGH